MDAVSEKSNNPTSDKKQSSEKAMTLLLKFTAEVKVKNSVGIETKTAMRRGT